MPQKVTGKIHQTQTIQSSHSVNGLARNHTNTCLAAHPVGYRRTNSYILGNIKISMVQRNYRLVQKGLGNELFG